MATNVFKGVDWTKAPDWATYWTCDAQVGGCWWKNEPTFYPSGSFWAEPQHGGRVSRAPTFGFYDTSGRYEDSLVIREVDENLLSPENGQAWIWCTPAKNSGGFFATEAEAARSAIENATESEHETFYVCQVTRSIKSFKRSKVA